MANLRTGLLSAVCALGVAFSAMADVKVGDKMPSLEFDRVVKNEYEVDLTDLEGYVVVVEFWATWCGPCKASIPHLNEMHKKFKDKGVVFIGMSNEEPATVQNFLKQMKMEYIVVAGSKSNRDFGVNAIPHAFVVDPEGIVRWAGHPMQGLDKQVSSAVAKYKPERRLGGGPEWNAKLLERIQTAIAKRDFETARLNLRRIDKEALGEPGEGMQAQYRSVMMQISAAAESEYELAMNDVQAGRYNVAIETLRRLADDFADMPIGKQASATLTKLQNDPKVAQARRSSVNEKLASNALKRARRAMSDGDDLMAYRRLKAIVDRYAGTDAANEAKELITKYTDDADFMAKLDSDGG